MLDSTGIGIGTLLLATIACLFFNPILALIPLALLAVPVTMLGLGKLWSHAAPAPSEDGHSPAVPSTREASYDPRTIA
jgi:hypothetical protein